MSLMSVTYYRITNSQRVVWCIKRQEQSEAESRSKVQISFPPPRQTTRPPPESVMVVVLVLLVDLAVRRVDLGPLEDLLPLQRRVVPGQVLGHRLDLHRAPHLRVFPKQLTRVGHAVHETPGVHGVEQPPGART